MNRNGNLTPPSVPIPKEIQNTEATPSQHPEPEFDPFNPANVVFTTTLKQDETEAVLRSVIESIPAGDRGAAVATSLHALSGVVKNSNMHRTTICIALIFAAVLLTLTGHEASATHFYTLISAALTWIITQRPPPSSGN